MSEWSTPSKVSKNGLNATFAPSTVHCLAAEPDATFLRVVILDNGQEVAYETAVLGRLRGGYRVFQLRGELGTRIQCCYLLVKISFGIEPNQWPAPSHLRLFNLSRKTQVSELQLRIKAQANEIKAQANEISELHRRLKEAEELGGDRQQKETMLHL